MPEFASSGVTNATPNLLANIPAAIAQGQTLQANALANTGAQTALDNQQTFKDNTAGMLARDPAATATALGANPQAAQAFLSLLPQMDQDTRQQVLQDTALRASMAGAILNAPPDQRPALWAAGRQQLAASGAKNLPSVDYPGDHTLHLYRGIALSAQEQFGQQGQMLTATPQSPMQATPGGGYVGPGGAPPPSDPSASAAPSGGYSAAITQGESGGNPNATNPMPGQTAAGADGFTDGTWVQTVKSAAPQLAQGKTDDQLLAMRSDPTLSGQMTVAYAQQNAPILTAAGFKPTSTNLALAHNFGPGGATRLLQAAPNTPMATLFSPHVIAVNPQLAKMTAGQVVQAASARMANVPSPVAPVQVASNSGAAGLPPTANDAAPSGSTPGFATMLGGLYRPGAPADNAPASAQPADSNAPITQPAEAPPPASSKAVDSQGQFVTLPASPSDPAAGMRASPRGGPNSTAGVPSNALAASIVARGALPQPAPNALLSPSVSAAPQNNLLGSLPAAAPQPGTAPTGQTATPPSAGLATDNQDAGKTPLFQGNQYAPVPGAPGYVFARDQQGNRTTMRMPGLPPQKGVETKFQGGTMIQTDAETGRVIRVVPNAVPDSSRQTSVQGTNSDGTPGTLLFQDGKQVGFVPASTQPIQMAAYQSDLARSGQVAQQATDAEQQIQRALEARNYARGLPTGAGGDDRAALSTWLKTYAPAGVYQSFIGNGYLPDAPQAQEAAKVMLGQAALDEKAMGGSGGLGLTEKYEKANPSLNMTPEAIAAMSNLKAVTAQSAADYANGYLGYFKKNADSFTNGGKYQPAADFDQAWHSQPNVQTYLGAIDAMNGKPYAEWSKGLSPQVQQRALGVIARIDPTTVVNGQRGRILVNGQPQAGGPVSAQSGPAVGAVQGGYRFNGGDPSSPGSWARVQ